MKQKTQLGLEWEEIPFSLDIIYSFQQKETTITKRPTHRRPYSFTSFHAELPLESVHSMVKGLTVLLGKSTFTAI